MRHRKAVEFCVLVIKGGGRLFITTPAFYEIGRSQGCFDSLFIETVRQLQLMPFLETYYAGTKNGEVATEAQVDLAENRFGSYLMGSLKKGVGGFGGVADAMIVSEAQLADVEDGVVEIPFLTLDDGIVMPLARSVGINSKQELVKGYGYRGFNVNAAEKRRLRILPIFSDTNERHLYNNMGKPMMA